MSAVPKPNPDARSRRKDISGQGTKRLPVSGRIGDTPRSPIKLGPYGRRWWRWVWTTPQALTFHKGFIEPLARRAHLEDVYQQAVDGGVVAEVTRLLSVMTRIDGAFGLTPEAAAKQHIVFTDDTPVEKTEPAAKVTDLRSRLKGMRD